MNQMERKKRFYYSQPDNAVLYDKALPKTTYQLYNILDEMSHKKTHEVTVRVSVLADRLGRSTITTRRHLSLLVKFGIIIRVFNKDTSNPKLNLPSTFIVLGRFAKRYENSEYAVGTLSDDDRKRQYPPVKNDIHKDKREDNIENKEITLKREAELPKDEYQAEKSTETVSTTTTRKETPKEKNTQNSNQEQEPDLSGVPEILPPVAKDLLDHTGRSQLYDTELPILSGVLYHQHTPTRIVKEIDKFIEHFNKIDRPLQNLTFNYLGTCLSNQVSLVGKKKTTNKTRVKKHTQIDTTQIKEQILPIQEAERIISEYIPVKQEQDSIPYALDELYKKMAYRQAQLVEQYADSLPTDEEGLPDWNNAEHDIDGFPKLPKLPMDEYLKLKFPEAEEEELRIDRVNDSKGLEQALEIDRTCASCDNPESCPLKRKGGRPAVYIKNHRLFVGYTLRTPCKHEKNKPEPEFESRVKHSGLSASQTKQTFSSYEHKGMPEEIVSAKASAILAAKKHTSLIIAGKAGTGKTHLASAIALEAMREGKQAIFRTVPDLLEELKQAAWEHKDFFGLRQKFRDVPCLVLDDLGKEKTTDKGLEYLYQIIDYRYKHGKQTIVTTNALDIGGLMNKWNADKIEPLVSRILDNGHWVTIRNAENHRLSHNSNTK